MGKVTRPAIGFNEVLTETAGLKHGRARWDGKPKRPPKQGEFYISGAHPVAYRARKDLSQPYFIAVVTASDGKQVSNPAPATPMDQLADRIEALAECMKSTAQQLRMLTCA